MPENAKTLKDWRRLKKWRQEDVADRLGAERPTYQAWESGRTKDIPPEFQAKLRKLGYNGPWPREEAQEAPAAGAGAYVTREEYAALSRETELLRKDLEGEKRKVYALQGAIRQLAKASNLHHLLEQIE